MSSAERGREGRKRQRSKSRSRDGDADVDLDSDIKEALSWSMRRIREQAENHLEKKRDETMKRVASEVGSTPDNVESKLEEERQKIMEALMKQCKAYFNAERSVPGESMEELPDTSSSTFFKDLRSLLDNY